MLKLKFQYFGHLMWRVDSLEKTLMLGGIGGEGNYRGWDGWMASPTRWAWVWVNSGSWWWTGRPGVLQCMVSQRVGHDWATELNWFIRMTDAEDPILWPPNANSQPTGKDPDAGKDWGGQEEKGVTEDEMAGWHHQLNGNKFEQTPGDSEGQGSLACCSPWDRKGSDTT